jgi:hypothetical protein
LNTFTRVGGLVLEAIVRRAADTSKRVGNELGVREQPTAALQVVCGACKGVFRRRRHALSTHRELQLAIKYRTKESREEQ